MANKKRHPKLKATVAISSLKGTPNKELAKIYDVHSAQVSQWTKKLVEDAHLIFEPSDADSESEDDQ